METRKVVLKRGKEKPLCQRHPWIFSGAIAERPSFENGEILPVYSAEGNFLAKAYFHRENSIAGRVLTFNQEPIHVALDRHLSHAISLRKQLFAPLITTAYRLVNAEGDHLPGLVVDIYDDIAVVQFSTCGMDRLKSQIVELLKKKIVLRGIYEKSHSAARIREGLPDAKGILFGECSAEVLCRENGLQILVPIENGQKTGFFLDQREMRQLVGRLAKNRRVLNCFAYTGGFSLFALENQARSVVSVDSSELACHLNLENTRMNRFPFEKHEVVQADVFEYLRRDELPFDLIILDPPAFAKRRSDVDAACRGYKEINRLAMAKCPSDSFLLTSSCSHFIDETLFQQVVFQAAIEANREVVICSRHIHALDHPVSLFHPEGAYLKSLLLRVL